MTADALQVASDKSHFSPVIGSQTPADIDLHRLLASPVGTCFASLAAVVACCKGKMLFLVSGYSNMAGIAMGCRLRKGFAKWHFMLPDEDLG